MLHTVEREINEHLALLDLNVHRTVEGKLETDVYRKPTHRNIRISHTRNIAYSNRPDRVAQLAERWVSIPKVVGSIPTVARHIFQACPLWIYTQSNITQASDKYLSYNSHHPVSHKRSVAKTLLQRAESLPSNSDSQANEREYVLNVLGENNYPKRFLNDCLRPPVCRNQNNSEGDTSVKGYVRPYFRKAKKSC